MTCRKKKQAMNHGCTGGGARKALGPDISLLRVYALISIRRYQR
jgi:hypothetical protein